VEEGILITSDAGENAAARAADLATEAVKLDFSSLNFEASSRDPPNLGLIADADGVTALIDIEVKADIVRRTREIDAYTSTDAAPIGELTYVTSRDTGGVVEVDAGSAPSTNRKHWIGRICHGTYSNQSEKHNE
jgi:hypothetical protein